MENGVVCVDDGGGCGCDGGEGGLVPVFVRWKNGGFGVVLNLDDEG